MCFYLDYAGSTLLTAENCYKIVRKRWRFIPSFLVTVVFSLLYPYKYKKDEVQPNIQAEIDRGYHSMQKLVTTQDTLLSYRYLHPSAIIAEFVIPIGATNVRGEYVSSSIIFKKVVR